MALRIYAISAVIASFYISFCQVVGDERCAMPMNTIQGGISFIGIMLLK